MCGIKVGSVQRMVEGKGFTVARATKAKPRDVNSEFRFYLLAIHDRNGQAVEVSALNPNFQSKRGRGVTGQKINPDEVTVKVLDHRHRKFVVKRMQAVCFDSIKETIVQVARGAFRHCLAA